VAVDLTTLLGLIGTIGGGALSANAAGNTSDSLSGLLRSLGSTQLQPFQMQGPGGQWAGLNPNGALPGASGGGGSMYAGGSGGWIPTPGGGMQPIMTMGAGGGSGATGMGGGMAGVGLGSLDPAFNSLVNYGTSEINNAANMPQFGNSLQGAAYGGAINQINDIGSSYQSVFNNILGNMRANAAPDNLLAANKLQDSLFGTGRLGSTGGGLLAESFAKGLGQADASYQLAAMQGAQQQRTNSLGLAQGLAGIGGDITNLDQQLRTGTLGRGLQALAGQAGLNTQGLNNFQAALQSAIAQTQARTATAGAQASLAGAQAQTPTSGDVWGQILTGIGGRLLGNNNVTDFLGSIFGNGSSLNSNNYSDWANNMNEDWLNNVNIPELDFSNSGGGFNGAGGQAAAPTGGTAGTSGGVNLSDVIPATSPDVQGNFQSGDWAAAGGNLVGIYQGIENGTVPGYASAAANASQLFTGGSNPILQYAAPTYQAVHGDATGGAYNAAVTYVGGPAAIGNAIASVANNQLIAHGDEKRNAAAWAQLFPGSGTKVLGLGRAGYQYGVMPDGKTIVDPRYMEQLMGAFFGATVSPDGNQDYWRQEYDRLAANPVPPQHIPKGYVMKDGQLVRG
jgi:hypothetical protein